MILTIVLRNKVDLNTSERRDTLVDGLLRDTSGNIALGTSGSSSSDRRASQSGASSEELASCDANDGGKRGSRAILDERGKADGTGGDGGGGTHVGYDKSRVCRCDREDWRRSWFLDVRG